MTKRVVIPQEVLDATHKTLGSGLRAKPAVQQVKYEKVNTRVDYQPDICKDFYETGYCGYGDNCKFIHDRSETKSSLVLEREWEQNRKRAAEQSVADRKKELEAEIAAEKAKEAEERRQRICPACDREYCAARKTMAMRCGDWVCSACAVSCKVCPVCGKPTSGVFKAVRGVGNSKR